MKGQFPKHQLILLGGDFILIIASFYLAPVLRFGLWLDIDSVFSLFDVAAIFIYLLIYYIFDFYNLEEHFSSMTYILRVGFAVAITNIFLMSAFYIFNIRPYGVALLSYSASLIFILTIGWRVVCNKLIKQIKHPGRIIILGSGLAGRFVYTVLRDRRDFKVVGFLDDDARKRGMKVGSTTIIGGSELLSDPKSQAAIDMVLVAVTQAIKPEVYNNLVQAKMSGVEVYDLPTFCEKVMGKVPVNHISDLWFVLSPISGVQKNIYNQKIKKVLDKFMSLIGLILSFPIGFITAIAIKLDSEGPIFYSQARVGRNGSTFGLIKFRSMRIDAEMNGAVWATENDPRVTRVGRIIRLMRFDEIPQFWNVIRGDMSIVGPRPERPEFVRALIQEIPYYSLRHAVAPGITGWAQINYPYGASKEDALEKLQYDLYYIKNLSPLMDLIILARTVRTVLFGSGAR